MQPKKFVLVEGKSQMHIFLGSRDRAVQPVMMLIGDRTWNLTPGERETPKMGRGQQGRRGSQEKPCGHSYERIRWAPKTVPLITNLGGVKKPSTRQAPVQGALVPSS